jgi:hypothetical protein
VYVGSKGRPSRRRKLAFVLDLVAVGDEALEMG